MTNLNDDKDMSMLDIATLDNIQEIRTSLRDRILSGEWTVLVSQGLSGYAVWMVLRNEFKLEGRCPGFFFMLDSGHFMVLHCVPKGTMKIDRLNEILQAHYDISEDFTKDHNIIFLGADKHTQYFFECLVHNKQLVYLT